MGRLGSRIPSHIQKVVSDEDDLSDVSTYIQRKSPAAITDYTLLDVSDGPKTLLLLMGAGDTWRDLTGTGQGNWTITVDGNKNEPTPVTSDLTFQDSGGDFSASNVAPPLRYDSTLRVEWEHNGSGQNIIQVGYILGSGPHSIAVVRGGNPVYMIAKNLSEEQIKSMNVPDGYKIVRNPEIAHDDPMTKGMWDGDKEEVVDHPYWKPFHDTLDELDRIRRRVGSQDVLDKIDENPTSFEDVLEGENPMEDPVEEAIQFWKEREEKRTSELSLSELR